MSAGNEEGPDIEDSRLDIAAGSLPSSKLRIRPRQKRRLLIPACRDLIAHDEEATNLNKILPIQSTVAGAGDNKEHSTSAGIREKIHLEPY